MRRLAFLTVALLCAAALRLYLIASVPPGLHYDLATNLLIGGDIAFGNYRPIFITAFTGREALFFYWLALLIRFLGKSIFVLHLAGSFLGLLTVPATYFAGRHVFAHDPNHKWLAALSAALLAGNFWHVLLSRLGYRLISEPPVQALALGFLFWGLRRFSLVHRPISPSTQRLKSWILIGCGGFFTGLAAYTYLAARAFPIPLAAALIVLLASRSRTYYLPITAYFLAAALTFAPLGYFFYTHPDSFLNRMSQVAPGQGDGALLIQSAVAAFKMILISGDPYERFNYPFRPIFDPILGAFFVIGLLVTVVRAVRARDPLARAAEVMLLVWIPAMLLPTILAVHEIFPSNVRAIGLIPLVFVPTARGPIEVVVWLKRFSPARGDGMVTGRRGWGVRAIALVSLLSLSLSTSFSYFLAWARWPNVYRDNDADLVAAARWLNEQEASNAAVFMSAIHYRHPALAVLANDYPRIRWSTGAKALAIPEGGEAIYLFPHSAPPPEEWIADWGSSLVAAPLGPGGAVDYWAYRFADAAILAPKAIAPGETPDGRSYISSYANFGNVAELLGFRRVRGAGNENVVVDLYWRVLNPPAAGDFRVVADLVDAWGYRWAQGFNDSFPSEQWRPGDTLITRIEIPTPIGLPPGDYRLAVTLFAPSAGERLTTIDAEGNFAGAFADVGLIAVERSTTPIDPNALHPAQRSDLQIGPLRLLGFDPPPTAALRPGEAVNLALYWQAIDAPTESYSVTLTLLPALVLESGPPVHGGYPTPSWKRGEMIVDRHAPRLPRDLAPGEYTLQLSVSAPSGESAATTLATLDIQPITRAFAAPQPSHSLDLNFGDVIALVGYDVDLQPSISNLTLYWRSLAETLTDYTVFVHILDAKGNLVAQRDVQPREGTYPTSLWMRGEYVSDAYSFKLAPGAYALEVGMYLPETGERLGEGRIGTIVLP